MGKQDFIILTEVKTIPERQAPVWEAMVKVAQAARDYAGCIEYQILQSEKDPSVTINYERWASEAEHSAFMKSADMTAFVEAIDIDNSFVGNPGPVNYKVME